MTKKGKDVLYSTQKPKAIMWHTYRYNMNWWTAICSFTVIFESRQVNKKQSYECVVEWFEMALVIS